ncbi:hypothetical protein A3D09_01520 [Candidatus Collierbacteria bacterium RIFCSPHIGHO2_02_FULL_49_10]|uniref:Methionyl-tRNA formyltransferase n=1 Tax=Candidatus Collierbacteria bacterium RIFCSPHIGHO2_02_FULL_49_10 TaxID=1817723 RepID=A0A1F5EXG8_9BACT|nr:MAG: hypothetical protein A3D09_01520 [Candidatus Collierbacteria bacterium RIFCSPHIGHO2_02_FULL_49_10]
MKKINFGKIERAVLFGGGKYLCSFALKLRAKKIPIVVFTSKRYLPDVVRRDGTTFDIFLKKGGIDFFPSEDINTDSQIDKFMSPRTLALSFGAPWIFKKDFIKKFRGKLLNAHSTRLPRYRGGASYSWQILTNDRLGAGTIHQIEPGIDNGKIVKQKVYVFPESCLTPANYFDFNYRILEKFLSEFLSELLAQRDFKLTEQNEKESSYFPRLNTLEQGFINWQWRAHEIDRFVRAFSYPYPGASTYLGNRRLFLKRSRIESGDKSHQFAAGLVLRKSQKELFVAAVGGTVVVKDVFGDDQKNLFDEVRVGDRLFTPAARLESAMAFKAVYTPEGPKKL